MIDAAIVAATPPSQNGYGFFAGGDASGPVLPASIAMGVAGVAEAATLSEAEEDILGWLCKVCKEGWEIYRRRGAILISWVLGSSLMSRGSRCRALRSQGRCGE